MKQTFFLLSVLMFSGCSKVEDDTKDKCIADCTTLEGRFISMDNEGLRGIKISLDYKIYGGELGGSSIRKIAVATTDDDGYFHKQFYLKDSELGSNAKGYFNITVDDSHLDVNTYIRSDNLTGHSTTELGFAIYTIQRRDTVIGNTYYLPRKSHIKVTLEGFKSIQPNDFFEVQTLYPFGPKIGANDFLNSEYATGFSGYGAFQATNTTTIVYPFVAENEENVIRLFRRKNGLNTIEDFVVFVPKDNTISLHYVY